MCILAILLFGIAVRLYYFFFNPSLWGDEASLANNIIKYPLPELYTRTLDNNQAAPPGYLVVVKLISLLLGNSELSLRLFALLSGIASVLVFNKLAAIATRTPKAIY